MTALRYVILHHEGIAEPHYDLMFETAPGSDLATWRANEWPIHHGSALTRLADHRRAYLDYEGPVSGDRGTVKRISAGTYDLGQNRDGLFQGIWREAEEFALVRDGPEHWNCFVARNG